MTAAAAKEAEANASGAQQPTVAYIKVVPVSGFVPAVFSLAYIVTSVVDPDPHYICI